MDELQKLDLLLLRQLDPLDFHHFALVLLKTHVDYATCGVEIAYYRFYEVEFYGFVFEWPSIVLEFLVGGLCKAAHVACRQMLEVNPAAYILFGLILQKLDSIFDPIQHNLLQKVDRILNQQLLFDEFVELLSRLETILG